MSNQSELDEFMARVANADPRKVAAALDAHVLSESLMEFVKGAWHIIEPKKPFVSNWHIEAIVEHLEAVERGEIKRLIINIPPRHSKSSIVSVLYPAWVWTRDPTCQFMCGSYAEKLAVRDNLKHRRIGESQWYRERWGDVWDFAGDQNQKTRFENNRSGYRICFGMTGGAMGDGADRLLLDDPLDRQGATSEAERVKCNETYDEALSTRLNDPVQSAIILIMQRLHQNDLSGHLLDGDEEWVHLMCPAHYDSNRHCVTQFGNTIWEDPRSEDGELLWPERFTEAAIDTLAARLGPFAAAGQLEQSPVPKGGGIIKEEWWKDWPPEGWAPPPLGKPVQLPAFDYVVASLDSAFTSKEENDPSALVILGMWRDADEAQVGPRLVSRDGVIVPERIPGHEHPKIMLAYAWEKWLTLHGPPEEKPRGVSEAEWSSKFWKKRRQESWGLVEWVIDTCRRYKVDRLLIEGKASGIDVANEMARLYANENFSVELVQPHGDKVSRVYAIAPLFANGRVHAPWIYDHASEEWRRPAWCDHALNQCSVFPKGEHDDVVDAISMGMRHLRDIGMAVRSDEIEREWDDELAYKPKSRALYEL